MLACAILFAFIGTLKGSEKHLFVNDNSKYLIENWAYNNRGQVVNGKKSIPNVDVNVIPSWKLCKDAGEVLVGVVDTGIDFSTIQDNVWINTMEKPNDDQDNDGNGYVDDCCGWDFYHNDDSLYDNYVYDHHGTYIANTIVSIAPNVKICNAKFLNGTYGEAMDSVSAIQYVIDQGAVIINCSWSFFEDEKTLYDLIAANPEVLFVCAAGNSNINLDEDAIYPASYDLENVICVSSINSQGEMYEYCAYGDAVDIVAPGECVAVVLPESDVSYVDGTSVSSAFVTGTAALLKGYDEQLSPSEVKDIIIKTAHKHDALIKRCAADGYLDVGAAIRKGIKSGE